MSDRSFTQRAQDDEDHRLALCGLSFDARSDEELEDQTARYYDLNIFAPGSSRARYPLGAKQGPRAWEETPARTGAVSLVPPPTYTDGETA